MKQSRFNSLYNGLNGAAKAVYAVVPMQERWTPHQISAELARKQQPKTLEMILGCLAQLVNAGLVKQNREGFIAVQVRPDVIEEALEVSSLPIIPEQKEAMPDLKSELAEKVLTPPPLPRTTPLGLPKLSVFERLSTLSERVAKVAEECNNVTNKISRLRDDIETAALQAEHEAAEHAGQLDAVRNENAAELSQLRQLKSLLNAIK